MDATAALKTLFPMAPLPTGLPASGSLHAPVSCLLCDIYGTLLISDSGEKDAVRQRTAPWTALKTLLAAYGHRIHPQTLLDRLGRAIAEEHAVRLASGATYPEVVIEKIWQALLFRDNPSLARAFALEFEILMNPVWPMPGLTVLLETARDNAVSLGLLSNAQFYTPIILEFLLGCSLASMGIDPQLTILSSEHGVAKPSLKLFQLAVRRLRLKGIPPEETVYIGNDMRNDIAPAKAAGFQTVLFCGDRRSLRLRKDDPNCSGLNPDLTVAHLDQLTESLQRHLNKDATVPAPASAKEKPCHLKKIARQHQLP
jgi:putative hydrolase of the HAD superfamily